MLRHPIRNGVAVLARIALALVLLPLLRCRSTRAETIPHAKACFATALSTGQPVRARTHVGALRFTAYASYDSDGWPEITYDPSYFALPPTVQAFLSLHECGHLTLHTTDEFRANCYAVAQGHWTKQELSVIERSHLAVGRLPPQYGGSGAAFWAGTKRTCPQFFR